MSVLRRAARGVSGGLSRSAVRSGGGQRRVKAPDESAAQVADGMIAEV